MKNNRYIYTIFLFTLTSVCFFSCRKEKIQPEQANSFIKYYGKGGTQTAGNVVLTPDGGYILVGTSDSYGNGKDILVIKTDKFGNEEWSKVLGGAGDDEGSWIEVATDGGYVLTGSVMETGGLTKNVYIAKLNSNGTVIWENNYGKADKNDYGTKIINTDDGGYVAVGTLNDSLVYVLKFNNTGDTTWTSTYGNNSVKNTGTAIQQYGNFKFITSAYTSSPDMLVTTGRVQINNNTYYYNPFSNIGKERVDPGVVNAVDILVGSMVYKNKYVLGSTNNNTIYITNIDSNEVNLFYKEFASLPQSKASLLSKTSDGGFVIAGSIQNAGNSDILVIRTDANANVIWSKTFGGSGNDYGTSAVQTNNGGFIVSGTIQFGGNGTGSNDVMTLIHIDANGELK